MTLSFDAQHADLTESALRLYRRRKSYQTTKWRNMVVSALAFAALGFLGFKSQDRFSLPVVCAAAGAWGAYIVHVTHDRLIRRQLARYLEREHGAALPYATTVTLRDHQLVSTANGTTRTFPLGELVDTVSDAACVELFFGERGLLLIPQRAFADDGERAAFLDAINRSN